MELSQLAAGYLGHFLLTNLVLGKLIAAKGIIINITSMAYTLAEVDTKDPNFDVSRMLVNTFLNQCCAHMT